MDMVEGLDRSKKKEKREEMRKAQVEKYLEVFLEGALLPLLFFCKSYCRDVFLY